MPDFTEEETTERVKRPAHACLTEHNRAKPTSVWHPSSRSRQDREPVSLLQHRGGSWPPSGEAKLRTEVGSGGTGLGAPVGPSSQGAQSLCQGLWGLRGASRLGAPRMPEPGGTFSGTGSGSSPGAKGPEHAQPCQMVSRQMLAGRDTRKPLEGPHP